MILPTQIAKFIKQKYLCFEHWLNFHDVLLKTQLSFNDIEQISLLHSDHNRAIEKNFNYFEQQKDTQEIIATHKNQALYRQDLLSLSLYFAKRLQLQATECLVISTANTFVSIALLCAGLMLKRKVILCDLQHLNQVKDCLETLKQEQLIESLLNTKEDEGHESSFIYASLYNIAKHSSICIFSDKEELFSQFKKELNIEHKDAITDTYTHTEALAFCFVKLNFLNEQALVSSVEADTNLTKIEQGYLKRNIISLCINNFVPSQTKNSFEIQQEDFLLEESLEQLNLTQKDILNFYSAYQQDPKEKALYLLTSGSTGRSKLVKKDIAMLNAEAKDASSVLLCFVLAKLANKQAELSLEELFSSLKLIASVYSYHMYGLTYKLFLSMSYQIIFDTELIHYEEELLKLKDANYIFVSSPAFIKHLSLQHNLSQIALVLSAGGVLDFNYSKLIHSLTNSFVYEIYGSTEASTIATRYYCESNILWQLAPNCKLVKAFELNNIKNNDSDKDQIESRDSFILQSHFACVENLLLDDKLELFTSEQVKEESPFAQIALPLNNIFFRLIGRKDKIVKINEKRISLTLIEQKTLAFPKLKIDRAIAIKVCKQQREFIGLVVTLKDQNTTSELLANYELLMQFKKELRLYLRLFFTGSSLPRLFRLVSSIPCDHMGKSTLSVLLPLFDQDD